LLHLLQKPWLCALSVLASLFDSGQNPFPLFSQNLKFVSLTGFTLPCNLLLPLPEMNLELLALGFWVWESWVLQWHRTSSKLGVM
jgi:hypothetical protein